jgi:hypothetical protein
MKLFTIIIPLLPALAAAQGLQFYPLAPCRIVDTRGAGGGFVGSSPFSGPSIAAASIISFPFQSATQATTTAPTPCGQLPATAVAYSLNLTVVPAGEADYITIWPMGGSQPTTALLDDIPGALVSNAAIVGAGTGGISVFNSGPSATDIVIDLNGYYAPTPVAPWGAFVLPNGAPGSWSPPPGVPPSQVIGCLPYTPSNPMVYATPGQFYYEPGLQTPVQTVSGSPFTFTYAVLATDTPVTIAAGLAALVTGNAALVAAGVTVSLDGMGDLTLTVPAALGVFGLNSNADNSSHNPSEAIAVLPGNEVAISGVATAGDTVSLYLSFSSVTTAPDEVWVCMIGKSQTGEWVPVVTAP